MQESPEKYQGNKESEDENVFHPLGGKYIYVTGRFQCTGFFPDSECSDRLL